VASTSEFNAEGGKGQVTVTTDRDCQWEARSDAGWLTISTSGAVQGSGTADFTVASTLDPITRTASLTIGEHTITITQRAAACGYRLSALELSVPSSGGTREIDVAASSALCEWAAQTDTSWVSFPTGRTFKGDGRLAILAPAWSGPLRQAELAIADQRVLLTQSNGCVYNLTPSSVAVPAAADRTSVGVQTAEGCPWTTVNQVPWVTVGSGAAAGPGAAQLQVAANSGRARSGVLTIAGRPFSISQASGCQIGVSSHTATWEALGGLGVIGITATPDCPWASVSQVNWITIASNSTGAGNGSITLLVAPNIGGPRSGTVTISGHTFTAYQLGLAEGN
jgi:hypothetical protein